MPASLDTTKRAILDVGESHQVTVTVPHIEVSKTSIFPGNEDIKTIIFSKVYIR